MNIDLGYLGSLSDDAAPQIVETFERHMGRVRLRNTIHCRRRVDGVTGLNLSVGTATGVRRALCPTSSAGQLTGR